MGCAALVGKPFVDMALVAEDGSACKLSDFVGKGKPVVIDFYTTWQANPFVCFSACPHRRASRPVPALGYIGGESTLPF